MDFWQFGTTWLFLTIIIGIRYLVLAGAFHWSLKNTSFWRHSLKLMQREPHPETVRKELYWSLFSSIIYAVPAAVVIELFVQGKTAIYLQWDQYPIWYIPFSVFIYLFLHDTYFYWTHRAMHFKKVFSLVHRVHHESRPPTSFAAFSFHPLESIISAWFVPFLLLFIPIHVVVLTILLIAITLCAILNHSGYEILPKKLLKGVIGKWFITAAHHDLHHKFYECNYGLYFRFWDKVCGTDIFEEKYAFLQSQKNIDQKISSKD